MKKYIFLLLILFSIPSLCFGQWGHNSWGHGIGLTIDGDGNIIFTNGTWIGVDANSGWTFTDTTISTITSDVGIGLAAPLKALHIDKASEISSQIMLGPGITSVNLAVPGITVSSTNGNNAIVMGIDGNNFVTMAWTDAATNYFSINTGNTRAISLQSSGGNVGIGMTAPSYPLDLIATNAVAGSERGINIYTSQTTTALTGTLTGIKASSRNNVASAAGTVRGGHFAAGNMDAGFNTATATGVFAEVTNKNPTTGATTWTNARGLEINMDLNQGSAGNVNTITNAYMIYGVYNLPTVDTYATVTNGYGMFLRNEQVGGNGQMLDAGFYLDDLNMGGAVKGWDYGIDFSGIGGGSGAFGTADIKLSNGATFNNSTSSLTTLTEANIALMGNVGIGTATPSAKLDIIGASDATSLEVNRPLNINFNAILIDAPDNETSFSNTFNGLYIANSNTTNNNWAKFSFGDADNPVTASVASQITDHTNNYGDLSFWTRSAAGISCKLRILEGGNVGIGTDVPSEELQVIGDIVSGVGDDNFLTDSTYTNLTVTGELTLTNLLPAGYYIDLIVVQNSTANVVTNFDVGFTDAGGEIIAANDILANQTYTNPTLLNKISGGGQTTIYVSSANWNSANILLRIKMKRLF